ncbi:DsrE family protein [Croceicoccus sediminis]|uniref:DsrE family protein n=1 Tax=Croceicoccus sediminis TaxID=2571150 RepID=UPI001F0E85E3|nr:DsrE family protein [Croceicoccus sediminis]
MKIWASGIAAMLILATPAAGQDMSKFDKGPVFTQYGPHAPVETDIPIPAGTVFKVAFDASDRAEDGKINRKFESLARFINMHVANGVPEQDIRLAIVLHGGAVDDVLSDDAYGKRHDGAANPNADLVRQLLAHDVRFIVCGQSATASNIEKSDLMEGVEMALSAMTAHALLNREGFTTNPF